MKIVTNFSQFPEFKKVDEDFLKKVILKHFPKIKRSIYIYIILSWNWLMDNRQYCVLKILSGITGGGLRTGLKRLRRRKDTFIR